MTKGHWLPLALAPAPLCRQHISIAAAKPRLLLLKVARCCFLSASVT